MADNRVSRRDFVKAGAVAAAGVAVGVAPGSIVYAGNPTNEKTDDILNYNEQMEYRRAGKTELKVSAVCLGGHWKRVDKVVSPDLFKGKGWLSADLDDAGFQKNRSDVVSQCIERGINYIDACTDKEIFAYSKALKGRRDKMYLGYSWHVREVRKAEWRTFEKLTQGFVQGLKEAGLEYADVWRITCNETSSRHSDAEIEEMIKALDWAKKAGLARFTGISTHDRPHIKGLIEKYPDQLEVIVTPYTAKTKMAGAKIEAAEEGDTTRVVRMADGSWQNSLWYAMQKCDVAWFGIKPFTSGTAFKGDSTPGNPHEEEDNKTARLTIRAILQNPVITAPIPGLITPAQVDEVARAVALRRKLDVEEQAHLDAATDRAFANLPYHYRWLKDWEYV